jgi:DNA-nicking Smr family endonuclease
MSRKRRGLGPDEMSLWQRVADSTRPLDRPRARNLRPAADPPTLPLPGQAPAKPPPPPIPAFRIGEAAPGQPGRTSMQPGFGQRAAAAPLRMDRKAFAKLGRGKLEPEARIDLHGMTLAEAHPALIGFILRAQSEGRRLVLVVTGKGRNRDEGGPMPVPRGILRHQVPDWLARPPIGQAVLQVAEAHRRHGGAGAFYVYLRRRA